MKTVWIDPVLQQVNNVTLGAPPSDFAPEGVLIEVVENDCSVGIGWSRQGVGLYAPPPPDIPPPAEAPTEISMAQAEIALRLAGHWDAVLAIVDGLQEPYHTMATVAIAKGRTLRRDSVLVQLFANALGWNNEFLDQMFMQASEIEL